MDSCVYLQYIPVRGVVFVKAEEGVALDSIMFLCSMCVFLHACLVVAHFCVTSCMFVRF